MCEWRVATVVLAASVFIGCGTPRPIMYYELQIPASPAHATFTYPIDVVVGRINGSNLMESASIVYKTKQNQTGTYQYHRWSDTPVDMIQAKLARMLRASGEYRSVSSAGNPSAGEMMVRGRLYDFTEVDDEKISGLVSMEIELFNRKSARVLWTHFYTGSEPVEGKQVWAVAQALDRNLDRGLKEVVTGLSNYFASNLPVKLQATGESEARPK